MKRSSNLLEIVFPSLILLVSGLLESCLFSLICFCLIILFILFFSDTTDLLYDFLAEYNFDVSLISLFVIFGSLLLSRFVYI